MADYVNPRAQACQNCVKAKAKCYGHHEGKCERCSRLGRDCVMQAAVPRLRNSGKTTRQVQAGRIIELEAKVNSLMSLLNAGQSPSVTESTPNATVTPESITTPSSGSTFLDTALPSSVQGPSPTSDRDTQTIPINPEALLDIFKQNLAHLTPFISIPSHVDAQTLSAQRPFLYQAIITVSSYHDSVHHTELGQQLVKDITESLVVRGQKSLDLLQGLLVYISWYNNLFQVTSQLNTLLGLAFSLVVDLNLYLPIARFEDHEKFLYEMKGIIICQRHQALWARRAELTKEESRTILGCFYLFSCVSTNFCRVNPLRWAPHIQRCYDDILKDPENENDIYLAYLSALQRISEDIKLSGIRGFPSQPRTWNTAIRTSFKLLMAELERFKFSLPDALREDFKPLCSFIIMLWSYISSIFASLCHLPSSLRFQIFKGPTFYSNVSLLLKHFWTYIPLSFHCHT